MKDTLFNRITFDDCLYVVLICVFIFIIWVLNTGCQQRQISNYVGKNLYLVEQRTKDNTSLKFPKDCSDREITEVRVLIENKQISTDTVTTPTDVKATLTE